MTEVCKGCDRYIKKFQDKWGQLGDKGDSLRIQRVNLHHEYGTPTIADTVDIVPCCYIKKTNDDQFTICIKAFAKEYFMEYFPSNLEWKTIKKKFLEKRWHKSMWGKLE